MSRKTIGILDYGVSNLASVWRALHALDYRCRVSRDPAVLNETDLLILPGVGAFPAAMEQLHQHDLVEYIRGQARLGKPLLGICLGMQLLADVSTEHRTTAGLGLIPGEVKRMPNGRWHIGWNSIELVSNDRLLAPSDGQSVYFNHSFVFDVPQEYQVCVARLEQPFAAVVRRGNIVGVQFHPEKSQIAGRRMLSNLIEGLCLA